MPELPYGGHTLASVELMSALSAKPDCAVICTDHTAFDYDALVNSDTLVVDTRNALRNRQSPRIFRL